MILIICWLNIVRKIYKTDIDLSKDKYKEQKERFENHCIKAKIELSYDNEITIGIESIIEMIILI